MKVLVTVAAAIGAVIGLTGCQTLPPGAEPGPNGTMAYDVLVDATTPGAQIVANGQSIGTTPVHLKIFGDPDGTFHDFGNPWYEVQALPVGTNQFQQTRYFGTGHLFGPEDRIPHEIYFDMNHAPSTYAPQGPPGYYGYPYGPPSYYYGPPYPFYWGPEFRFYVHPRGRHWR